MTASAPIDPAPLSSAAPAQSDASSPRHAYTERLEARRQDAAAAWTVVRTLGSARLVVFAVFVVMAWFVTERQAFPALWLWLPVALFVGLVLRHRSALGRHERAALAVAFYTEGLHRLDETWSGRGVSGERFRDARHPYSGDLDIFGDGSLFQRLCLARTARGEERLADWLRAPASLDVARERQEAAGELRTRLDLHEALATVTDARTVIEQDALCAWAERPVHLTSTAVRIVAAIFGLVTFSALMLWAAGGDARPFLVLFVVEQAFALLWRDAAWQVIRGIDRPRRDLDLLARFLAVFETAGFEAPLLRRLRERLDGAPSERLRSLIARMEYAEAWRNIFFAPFAVVLLWALQLGFAIEGWRCRHGSSVRVWLDTLAELEALLSLGAYAFERPCDVFPDLVDAGPCFEGEGIAHPLIPTGRAVRNSVRLDRDLRLVLVSGSNMAGKSSLLRTVGTNTVLALAGAPVCARALRVSLLTVGACMRIQDSLQAGVSHFYAEITRLRQVVDMAGDDTRPLLFLLDEILHGTNSHDRRIGAEAVVRTLVARGAVGLVTTHDLALTRIVETLTPHAVNVHFQDEMVEGRMQFDYTLRAGVVEKSNAIALMRAVGLEV